jgi:hypothetical protein
MEYGLNRTERIEVRVSPEEYDILDRVAKRNKVTVSEYLRWMAMWAAFKSGDRGALRYVGERIKDDYWENMQRFYDALGLPALGKKEVQKEADK